MTEPELEITCRELVELGTAYLDEALGPLPLELVEEHLVICEWCRDYLDQMRATVQAVGETAAGGDEPPAELLSAVLGALREEAG